MQILNFATWWRHIRGQRLDKMLFYFVNLTFFNFLLYHMQMDIVRVLVLRCPKKVFELTFCRKCNNNICRKSLH